MTFAPENFRDYIGAAMALGLDAPALAVVVALRFHADDEGRVYRTVAEISADAGVNRKTAMDRLVHLAALKIVERVVESRRGNVYQLSPIQKSATRTTEVRHADHRSPPEGPQKSATWTSEVRQGDFRSPPDGPLNHRGSYSGSDLTAELHNKAAAADAQAPTHTHEAMPLPVETAGTPELAELVNAWWATQLGQGGRRPGFIVPPAVLGAIAALLKAHGPDRLRWAIGAAVEKTNQGAPSIAFLTRLCEGGPLPERARPSAPGGYQGAAYKSVNGVAEPREVPEGKW